MLFNLLVLAGVASGLCVPTTSTSTSATSTTTSSSSGGTYLHPNGNNNLCLTLRSNTRADGTPVEINTCTANNPAQQWTLTRGSTAVQLTGTNYCLDAGSSPGNGVRLKVWTCYAGLAAQTWWYTDDNRVALQGQGLCVDLTDGNKTPGNVLQTWACGDGNTNQVWTSTTTYNKRAEVQERATCSKAALTPGGRKAGLAGGDTFDDFKNYVGWWYDWSAVPSGHTGSPVAVPMLWGDGHRGSLQNDASRFAQFTSTWSASHAPDYVLGFNEPDCSSSDSSDLAVSTAASVWNRYLAPLGNVGTLLVSPAMCRQLDENFLTPFQAAISTPFDVVAVHIYKPTLAGAKADLDYYWNKYQKPMWVTEFGCVNDVNGFVACSSQATVNQFITDVVALFQSDSRVYAYAAANVGNAWTMGSSGSLTTTGKNLLAAYQKYA